MAVIKVIVPEPIDIKEVTKAIDMGLIISIEDAKVLFALTYQSWDAYPIFEQKGPRTVRGDREVEYSTGSDVYVWLDDGTDPHTISGNPTLTFMTDSIPKTKKSQLMSSAGFKGSEFKRKKEVKHPGVEARNFSEEVVERIDKVVDIRMQKQLDGVDSL